MPLCTTHHNQQQLSTAVQQWSPVLMSRFKLLWGLKLASEIHFHKSNRRRLIWTLQTRPHTHDHTICESTLSLFMMMRDVSWQGKMMSDPRIRRAYLSLVTITHECHSSPPIIVTQDNQRTKTQSQGLSLIVMSSLNELGYRTWLARWLAK